MLILQSRGAIIIYSEPFNMSQLARNFQEVFSFQF